MTEALPVQVKLFVLVSTFLASKNNPHLAQVIRFREFTFGRAVWSSSRFAAHHPINLKSHCRHYATLTLVSFHANSTNYVLSSFRCSSWRNSWFLAYRGLVNMVFKAQVSPKAKHKLVINPGKQAITTRPLCKPWNLFCIQCQPFLQFFLKTVQTE